MKENQNAMHGIEVEKYDDAEFTEYIWQLNYWQKEKAISKISELDRLQKNKISANMVQLFSDNKACEFFVVLQYRNDQPEYIKNMFLKLHQIDAKLRIDLTFDDLFKASLFNKHIGSVDLIAYNACDLVRENIFWHHSRCDVIGKIEKSVINSDSPLFLSHKSKYKQELEELTPYLTSRGKPVWLDKYRINQKSLSDEIIQMTIKSGVSVSGVAIFWITNDFLDDKNWCEYEVDLFIQKKIKKTGLIAVIAPDVCKKKLENWNPIHKMTRIERQNDDSVRDVARKVICILKDHFGEYDPLSGFK